jgi:hypothetical protein
MDELGGEEVIRFRLLFSQYVHPPPRSRRRPGASQDLTQQPTPTYSLLPEHQRSRPEAETASYLLKAPSRNVTTSTGLESLTRAGWKLWVLDFGTGITRRGAGLLEFLSHTD